MYFTLIFVLLGAINAAKIPQGGLYTRIEPYRVLGRIQNYLDDNGLHNCFGRRIDQRLLIIKCWDTDEGLVDVHIETRPTRNYQVDYI